MSLPLFDHAKKKADDEKDKVLRVVELNRLLKSTLESGFGDVWVEGELSDVTRAASGHIYFTLNDGKDPAQLRSVMFRNDARRAKATFADGERVRLRGGVSLYEARGSTQFIARVALPAGQGDLHAEFERLRKKLEAEGLLDPTKRRPLPRLPRVVGVVTSLSGAALHDIIRVAKGRCPVRLIVSHCLVQGAEAPASIVKALDDVQRHPEVEVVIVGRGGGSSEDLFAFNDERVARAIARCRVPIVSAVGHEVDVTIADLVADLRAATPSNAAELVVPDHAALQRELESRSSAMGRAFDIRLGRERLRLDRQRRRLGDPSKHVARGKSQLLAIEGKLAQISARRLARDRSRLSALLAKLSQLDARTRLARDRSKLDQTLASLLATRPTLVDHRRASFGSALAKLDALSPLAVLLRGYAIALHEKTGKALVRAADAAVGDRVTVRVAEGSLVARVEEIRSADAPKTPTE